MPFLTRCPSCATDHEVVDRLKGREIACRGCQRTFVAIVIDKDPSEPRAYQVEAGRFEDKEVVFEKFGETLPINDIRIPPPPVNWADETGADKDFWGERVFDPGPPNLDALEDSRHRGGFDGSMLLLVAQGLVSGLVFLLLLVLLLAVIVPARGAMP